MTGNFQAPKGVSEYIPPRSNLFVKIMEQLEEIATLAGYESIELPIFEDTELFTRGVGESTDVVTKEMYTFEDRGGRSLTLRPEGTAGVMRAVIEHGLDRGQLPVKLYYRGPFFRAERPQAGRYRQFYQFGIEAIGISDPYLDAEVIKIAYDSYQALGLKEFLLHITSLGDKKSRAAHRKDLLAFIANLELDDETRLRANKNPLRLFDDKRESVMAMMSKAPVLLDYLSPESSADFAKLRSLLDQLRIQYQINPRMVRGLDYYTGTTFEFVHAKLGAQSGIGGGGRYDGLMATLGGQDLSGIGFGLGVDRILLAMEAEGIAMAGEEGLDVYVIPLGVECRDRAFSIVSDLRQRGISVDQSFGDRALKGAMKAADKKGAHFVIVLGETEIDSGLVELKDMSTGKTQSVTLISLGETLASLVNARH